MRRTLLLVAGGIAGLALGAGAQAGATLEEIYAEQVKTGVPVV